MLKETHDNVARSSANPYVFIVGCPRSGTTLLQRIVDAHPEIAITPETHWVPAFFRDGVGLTTEGFVLPELVEELFSHRNFSKMGISHVDLEGLLGDGRPVSYSSFVSGIFDLYGRQHDKPLVGDKSPGYARDIPLLHTLWPAAKFIHLIRDGRDVCLSAINWKRKIPAMTSRFPTWAEDPVTTAALWWECHVRLAREAGNALGPDLYSEIRYEALVAHPAEECARLCAFLGVPYVDTMLRFHEGRFSGKAGQDAKHSWQPITPGLRNWRTQMPSRDVENFEAAVGNLLGELGLPRGAAQPSLDSRNHASRIRKRFPLDFIQKKQHFPRA